MRDGAAARPPKYGESKLWCITMYCCQFSPRPGPISISRSSFTLRTTARAQEKEYAYIRCIIDADAACFHYLFPIYREYSFSLDHFIVDVPPPRLLLLLRCCFAPPKISIGVAYSARKTSKKSWTVACTRTHTHPAADDVSSANMRIVTRVALRCAFNVSLFSTVRIHHTKNTCLGFLWGMVQLLGPQNMGRVSYGVLRCTAASFLPGRDQFRLVDHHLRCAPPLERKRRNTHTYAALLMLMLRAYFRHYLSPDIGGYLIGPLVLSSSGKCTPHPLCCYCLLRRRHPHMSRILHIDTNTYYTHNAPKYPDNANTHICMWCHHTHHAPPLLF